MMKRFSLIALWALLSGCLIIETPVVPTPEPPLRVLETTYSTSFSANGQAVICDDRPTQITYRFRYQGQLESWTSYLRGETLGTERGRQTFAPGSVGVNPYETAGYEVTYNLGPNTAPYRNGPDAARVSPQAIVVVPNPTPIGATRLFLVLRGGGGESRPYQSDPIPVISNCP